MSQSASLAADAMIDRRRLRRSLTLWRVLAVLAVIAALAAIGLMTARRATGGGTSAPHIARVTLSGFISGDQPTLTMFDNLAKSKTASAVIVAIDSPGGTAPGSEAVHDALRRVAATKPVVAVVRNMAASGGYIAAVGADRIYARQTSFVGSIGVIIQYPDASRLLTNLGVKVEEVKSSPLKAEPSPFKPTSDEARRALESLIADSYRWFRDLVKQRRGFDDAAVTQVADGRVFTGRQALDNRLIDALGDEKTAIEWLTANRGIAKDLAVRDWEPRRPGSGLGLLRLGAGFSRAMGWDWLSGLLTGAELDGAAINSAGVLALWRPPVE